MPFYLNNSDIKVKNKKFCFVSKDKKVVYGDINGSVNVVPEIPIPQGYDFSAVTNNDSYYLEDGRVVFLVSYGYDFGNGSFSSLYFYSPSTNDFTSFGALNEYAKSQAESIEDTERGDISNKGFVISNDNNSLYCVMTAWGVEGNSIHIDYYQILKYDLISGGIQKVVTTNSTNKIIGISFDDKYLITEYNLNNEYGIEVFDLSNIQNVSSKKIKVDEYLTPPQTQISKTSNELLLSWRNGGIAKVNFSSGEYNEILKQSNMKDSYTGLGYGLNYSKRGDFYFNAANDKFTNSNLDFTIYKYFNNSYDSLYTFESKYYYALFILME